MQFDYYGKNTKISTSIKNLVERKLDRLSRVIDTDDLIAQVNIKRQKNAYTVEITIDIPGSKILRAEATDYSLEKAVQDVTDKLVRKARKIKPNTSSGKRAEVPGKMGNVDFDEEIDYEEFDEDLPEIVRTKRFAVKPMSPEEAVLQMELLGHNFFIFLDAETNEIAVVYKRKKGGYGLIEPE